MEATESSPVDNRPIDPLFATNSVVELPWELTRQIFLTFARCESGHSVLGLICHSWRQVYIQTPQLWTKISVFPLHSIDQQELLTIQEKLLKRSGDLLVDITWSRSKDKLPEDLKRDLEIRFLDTIPPTRWRSLTIRAADSSYLLSGEYLKGQFENLQCLFIDGWVSESFLSAINSSAKNLRWIRLCPSLTLHQGTLDEVINEHTVLQTRVVLDSLYITTLIRNLEVDTLTEFTIPLTQVTSLRIHCYDHHGSRTNFPDLLPNLTTLHITQCIDAYGISFQPISLPNLLALTVGGPDLFILCYFDAPKLQSLTVTPGPGNAVDINSFERAIDEPTYQLSPDSIFVAFPLDFLCLYHLLSFSPRTRTLSVTTKPDLFSQLLPLLSRKRATTLSNGQRKEKLDFVEGLEAFHLHLWFVPTIEQIETAKQIASNLMVDPLRSSLILSTVRWAGCDGFRVEKGNGGLRII
jgi:hypothetical protein